MKGMVMLGKRRMQFLPELIGFADFLPVEVHVCPNCGKIDTFADFDGTQEALDRYISAHMDADSPDAIPEPEFKCPQCGEHFPPGLMVCPKCSYDLRRPFPPKKTTANTEKSKNSEATPRRKLPWEF